MTNSVDPDQIASVGVRLLLYSGSTLFASILNSSVMLGNSLQQTTSADNIFRPRGSWFEPHRRHCVVVLEQDTLS